MLLAAGLGTRLRPLTTVLPKPVVPVLDRPLAAYALEHLARCGVRQVVLNTHHLAHAVSRELGEELATPGGALSLAYSHEPEILGTAGGIRQMLPHVGGSTFLVLNGDVLFAPDLAAALAHHRATGALATLVVRRDPDAARWGAVEVAPDGLVRRLVGRPAAAAAAEPFMFTGVHVIEPELAPLLPERGCIVRDVYVPLLERGGRLAAYVEEAQWRDLGTVAAYLETVLDLASGKVPWPSVQPSPGGAWVGPGASIDAAASLSTDVVIGPAAHVGAVRLARATVWPGVRVAEDVIGGVAYADGAVVRS